MNSFYELIQVALGSKPILSWTPTPDEWKGLFSLSEKQAVIGVAFEALESLSRQGQKPPLDVLYQWIGSVEQIKQQNLIVNKRCVEISKLFAEAGYRTCILKGQGNARMYPNPLARTAGDIDIWVDAEPDKIEAFVRERFPNEKHGRMHINFPVFDDVPVEVHYYPRYMQKPKFDRQLQTFFNAHADEQFRNFVTLSGTKEICAVPTTEFNLVQQLAHQMSHFLGEGIGLRQFIDYYYVLKTRKENTRITEILKACGLLKFAGGVMWIEKELLGLEDKYLIVEPTERIGRAIQQTIEEGGNFGHHNQLNTLRHQSQLGRAVGGAWQWLRAMRYFPTEAIWKLLRKFI